MSKLKELRQKTSAELLSAYEQSKFTLMVNRGQLAKYKNQGKKSEAHFNLGAGRLLQARILTILNERGIKITDSMTHEDILNLIKAMK